MPEIPFILRQLHSINGVKGAFLAGSDGTIRQSSLSETFLVRAGITIRQLLAGKPYMTPGDELILRFKELIFLIRYRHNGTYLGLVCAPDIQPRTVLAAAQQMLAVSSGKTATGKSTAISCEQLCDNSPLAPYLAELKEAMSSVVGPVAGLLVEEATKKWLAAGPASGVRMGELADLLCAEIQDPAESKLFLRDISPTLSRAMKTGASPVAPSTKPATPAVDLSRELEAIRVALVEIVGPAGGLVFGPALQQWRSQGNCTRQGLPGFVELLCRELDDREAEVELRQKLQKIL